MKIYLSSKFVGICLISLCFCIIISSFLFGKSFIRLLSSIDGAMQTLNIRIEISKFGIGYIGSVCTLIVKRLRMRIGIASGAQTSFCSSKTCGSISSILLCVCKCSLRLCKLL